MASKKWIATLDNPETLEADQTVKGDTPEEAVALLDAASRTANTPDEEKLGIWTDADGKRYVVPLPVGQPILGRVFEAGSEFKMSDDE